MKRNLLLLLCSAVTLGHANAQEFKVISSNSEELIIEATFKATPWETTEINGVQYIDFSNLNTSLTNEAGSPALPLYHTSIQLPNSGNPAIEVIADEKAFYPYDVLPSKGSLKRNVNPADVPFVFGSGYQTNANYPGALTNLESPFIWRNVRGMVLTISPIQCNPAQHKIEFHSKITFKVTFNKGVQGENELQTSAANNVLNKLQQQMFINASGEKYTALEEEGDMLIIADPDYADEVQALVNWKNQKGIKTTLVTTTETGTTDIDIMDYVQNFYGSNPDLVYLLLVGDHADVPAHTYGDSGDGEELWSDSYYGQLAGSDFYPEVFVGRFSGTATQITTMVNRTLEYEKNPAAGDWMEKAIGLGSNEGDGIGNDGEPDWQHLRNIRTVLMSYGYSTVYEFYDGTHNGEDASGNPNSTMIVPVVNSGVGLFNYCGHGAQNVCVSGNFSSSNVNQATNNGQYPFVISVACNNGTFTAGSCISEAWLASDNNSSPAGAIAAAGSTILMAWAEPMQTQDEMAEIIAENYPSNKKESIGGLFYNSQASMLETYPGTGGKEVMQTWVLFGDPSTVFRNKQTMPIVVSHPTHMSNGISSLVVNCDVDNCVVAISQDNVLLGKAMSNGGTANVSFSPLSNDASLVVTVTKQNHMTYQAAIQVGNGPVGLDENLNLFSVYPVPATESFTVQSNAAGLETIELIDLNGITVKTQAVSATGSTSVSTSDLAAGNYILQLSGSGITSRRLVQVVK